LAVNTCTKNNFPLIVIGKGDELNNLRDIAGSNVEFVESCDDNNKFKILSGAKALIYPSRDEDFGIVPVEALKMGVPVIAFNSGGVKETVFEGKNGIFFDKYCEDMLAQAIKKFEKMNISEKECKKSVRQYSSYRFMKEIRNLI
jgi:glycosyltransferase involved in cell wall biosynthesis